VRDVIGIFLAGELFPDNDTTDAPADLMATTAANVYHGFCVESSQRPNGCDFYDILEFLSTSDLWIQIGGPGQVDEVRLSLLFERFRSASVQDNLPQGNSLDSLATWTGTLPSGTTGSVTPIAWGNYYFGTEGYNLFVGGQDSRLVYCERVRDYVPGSAPKEPYEYLFVITNIATGNPTTNYFQNQVGEPPWANQINPETGIFPCGQG
jgi:hypothetical protein